MDSSLERALENLTDIQQEAVAWGEEPLLVLAGPGSGKTQVLTCRIARILDASRGKNFRVLALTFTNKAADEMKGRVAEFVPGLEERANVGTFHSFCGQILRQHGVHIGINPDFAIYATDNDRKAVLEDGLRRAASEGFDLSVEDVRFLPLIDGLKARLIHPEKAASAVSHLDDSERIAQAYQAYEAELRRANALDFNSLILQTHHLAKAFPAIAARYRRSHPYWLLDEFQDTNAAQYELIKTLAGPDFHSIFAVADDDQIIYEWNGASFKQIQKFLKDLNAQVIQLPTNYRCPPSIVEAANRLVTYNAHRAATKRPLVSGKTALKLPESQHIQLRVFPDDGAEAEGIAAEIAEQNSERWSQTAVLGRTRALLDRMREALAEKGVPAVLAQRRDEFLSAEVRWLGAVLRQATRPLDRRNMATVVDAFNRLGSLETAVDEVIGESESTGQSYFATWIEAVRAEGVEGFGARLIDLVEPLTDDILRFRQVIADVLTEFERCGSEREGDSDLAEDLMAWREIERDITGHIGRNAPIGQFLQELQLRSKEPSPKAGTVTLMTIHGAKGREFDFVYVVGLAEDVMPSYQSRQRGDRSPEMEEERRNCFVAITRAKECLVLSRAERYRGWQKQPSRFLVEMDLAT